MNAGYSRLRACSRSPTRANAELRLLAGGPPGLPVRDQSRVAAAVTPPIPPSRRTRAGCDASIPAQHAFPRTIPAPCSGDGRNGALSTECQPVEDRALGVNGCDIHQSLRMQRHLIQVALRLETLDVPDRRARHRPRPDTPGSIPEVHDAVPVIAGVFT